MTSFLFIISFLLHIVSITAIYALSKQLAAKESNNMSEIVELMENYLEEIKLENQMFQEELSKTEKQLKDKKITETPSIKKEIDDSFQIPVFDEQQDEIEVSLQSRILKMYGEGISEEEIARKLGCGKTEVELIIKFHEKSNI